MEDQIIILMAEPAAVIPVIHGCPIATHFTFFPTFPFFFSSFFLLLLPFSHLAFSGRSSFRAVERKKRDKNRTQIPGVSG